MRRSDRFEQRDERMIGIFNNEQRTHRRVMPRWFDVLTDDRRPRPARRPRCSVRLIADKRKRRFIRVF